MSKQEKNTIVISQKELGVLLSKAWRYDHIEDVIDEILEATTDRSNKDTVRIKVGEYILELFDYDPL